MSSRSPSKTRRRAVVGRTPDKHHRLTQYARREIGEGGVIPVIHARSSGVDVSIDMDNFDQLKLLPYARIRKMFLAAAARAGGPHGLQISRKALDVLTRDAIFYLLKTIIKAGVVASAAHRVTIKYSDVQSMLAIGEIDNARGGGHGDNNANNSGDE